MRVEVATNDGKPYGSFIHLTHADACELTGPAPDGALARLGGLLGPYAAIVARAIRGQARHIRSQNEWSGGEGVKLLFVWLTGSIATVERRANGAGPCAEPCCRVRAPGKAPAPAPR